MHIIVPISLHHMWNSFLKRLVLITPNILAYLSWVHYVLQSFRRLFNEGLLILDIFLQFFLPADFGLKWSSTERAVIVILIVRSALVI